MPKKKPSEITKLLGKLENAVYGNTLEGMAEFERRSARNQLREEIAYKLGYHWQCTGVDEGEWRAL